MWVVPATGLDASGSAVSLFPLPFPTLGTPVVDGNFIYGVDSQNTLLKCNWSNCANTIEPFTMTPPSGVEPSRLASIVAQDPDYFYLIDWPANSNFERLLRVTKDASYDYR